MVEGNGELGKEKENLPQEPKEIVLKITFTPDGKLGVQAPAQNGVFDELICFYLLEKGKDFIKMHNTQMSQPKIQKPQPGWTDRLRGFLKK